MSTRIAWNTWGLTPSIDYSIGTSFHFSIWTYIICPSPIFIRKVAISEPLTARWRSVILSPQGGDQWTSHRKVAISEPLTTRWRSVNLSPQGGDQWTSHRKVAISEPLTARWRSVNLSPQGGDQWTSHRKVAISELLTARWRSVNRSPQGGDQWTSHRKVAISEPLTARWRSVNLEHQWLGSTAIFGTKWPLPASKPPTSGVTIDGSAVPQLRGRQKTIHFQAIGYIWDDNKNYSSQGLYRWDGEPAGAWHLKWWSHCRGP